MTKISLSLLMLLSAAPAFAGDADGDYAAAKADYAKLKGDQKRRKLRHHWQNVAHRFEAVARRYPKSDRAPEALYNAGNLNNELSRISLLEEDREAAKRDYRQLIDGWPKHTLADDCALALAQILADRENDPAGARKVLEATVGRAGDMKKSMQAMLAALPAPRPVKSERVTARAAAPEPRPEPKKAEAPPAHRSTEVTEAIRRAIAPLDASKAVLAELGASEQARRAPPLPRREAPPRAEPVEDEASADEVVEPSEPVATSLAERLRDVRVGTPAPVAGADAEALRAKFKKLAKSEPSAELSLAQQLGLKVRRVVVDAGHGGHDTGAVGPGGTREKDVSLAIATRLARKLEAAGLEVVMTRDDDTFVKLEDRTRFANRQKGDLFISIHCNAAPTKTLRGIETYTLNTSSNRYSIRLAARENATTEKGVGDLQYILADLATKANTGESQHLADRVQRSLVRDLAADYKNVKDLGTKEALFFVLLGAKMPAILVETSFLSHPEEEERLADAEYQEKIAASISEAVSGFLEERNKIAQVD